MFDVVFAPTQIQFGLWRRYDEDDSDESEGEESLGSDESEGQDWDDMEEQAAVSDKKRGR